MSPRFVFSIFAVAATVVTTAMLYNFGYVSFRERPGFTHVWGHVSYNGKPLPGCAIFFEPADPSKAHWGIGRLSDSGLYFLTAYQLDTILEPGRYTIFIRPLSPYDRGRVGADSNVSNSPLPLPKRFTDSKTSGLLVNIDGEPQRIEIHLTD
jgi:hypothetical protein